MQDEIFTLQDGTLVDAGTLFHDDEILSYFISFKKGDEEWAETFWRDKEEEAVKLIEQLHTLV